jgi:WD40 repeat protein
MSYEKQGKADDESEYTQKYIEKVVQGLRAPNVQEYLRNPNQWPHPKSSETRVVGTLPGTRSSMRQSSGAYAVTETGTKDSKKQALNLWDVWFYKKLREFPVANSVLTYSLSANAARLVCLEKEPDTECTVGAIKVWAVESGSLKLSFRPFETLITQSVNFNNEGAAFITGSEFCDAMIVWDAANGDILMKLPGAGNYCPTFTTRDEYIISCTESTFHVHNAILGTKVNAFKRLGHTPVPAMTMQRILCTDEVSIRAYDFLNGKQIFKCMLGKITALSVCFGAEDKTVVAGLVKGAAIWDVKTGKLIYRIRTGGPVYQVVYNPRTTMIMARYEKSAAILNPTNGSVQIESLEIEGDRHHVYGTTSTTTSDPKTLFYVRSMDFSLKI